MEARLRDLGRAVVGSVSVAVKLTPPGAPSAEVYPAGTRLPGLTASANRQPSIEVVEFPDDRPGWTARVTTIDLRSDTVTPAVARHARRDDGG